MIQINDKHNCCGCSACVQICPKPCISFDEDEQGFRYPLVNKDLCIDCGLCEKVCHELHPYEEREPLQALAAINKQTDVRLQSSSGGIFTILAERIMHEGGVVFGARYDDEWQVAFDYTETIEGLSAFRGSKYVQARVGDTYKQAEKFLKDGRKVLFTGTPCQIAGLQHYLRKPFDNLLTVDIICHGVPSPKVWGIYLNEVVTAGRKAIKDVEFRNKDNGWKKFNFKMQYDKDSESVILSSWHQQNDFMRAFLANLILRPSCYDCKAKHGRSHSDITIADFWGVNASHPEMDDDKGTGLILINTEKGKNLLDLTKTTYKEVDFADAIRCNPAWTISVNSHPHRDRFFQQLDDTSSVVDLINKELKPTLSSRIYQLPFRAKHLISRVIRKLIGGKLLKINTLHNIDNCDSTNIPTTLTCGQIQSVNFRNKTHGWSHYHMSITLTSKPLKAL